MLSESTLDRLIESSASDLRQTINMLQMWKNQSTNGQDFMNRTQKDQSVMFNNFDAASKLLNLGND